MSFTWNDYSLLHLALDGVILGTFAVVLWISRRHGAWKSLIAAWAATVFLGALVGGATLGFFFLARLLWTVSSVALPLGMVYWGRKDRRWLWAVCAAFLLGFKFYGEVVEPRRLEVTRITFRSPKVRTPIRVTHLTDIQTDGLTGMYRQVREASDGFDPHVIVFTGDMANHLSVVSEVEAYLKGFRHRDGAFMVGGNVDARLDIDAVALRAQFENVEGKARRLTVDGNPVAVAGVGIRDARRQDFLSKVLSATAREDLVLLLSHYPDIAFAAQNEPVDLVLAGHTHGGQVCLPWFGPVVTLSSVPRSVGAGGLHKLGEVWLLVSRGLGWEGHVAPRVRTFCRPQLILLEIVPG